MNIKVRITVYVNEFEIFHIPAGVLEFLERIARDGKTDKKTRASQKRAEEQLRAICYVAGMRRYNERR